MISDCSLTLSTLSFGPGSGVTLPSPSQCYQSDFNLALIAHLSRERKEVPLVLHLQGKLKLPLQNKIALAQNEECHLSQILLSLLPDVR